MRKQAIRQQARQTARDAALRRRRERKERERRLTDLAEQVLVAVAERDEAVADAERRVGAALVEFTDVEGLTLREAVAWCDGALTVREATRVRRLVDQPAPNGELSLGSAPGEGGGNATQPAR
jgi:hypothetical protein